MELKQKIISFLEQDIVSRIKTFPVRKDYISSKLAKRQTIILEEDMTYLCKEYLKESPDRKSISYSTFSKYHTEDTCKRVADNFLFVSVKFCYSKIPLFTLYTSNHKWCVSAECLFSFRATQLFALVGFRAT